ncbi:hypothetical protein NPIL_420611 [Nephila pilipes]|uniref:Uncharacterized protein n=1 Tax=Nephila pilipes TaxID=299642 RepID=A0A8X6P8K9_NEPPI|nr:hypothetical protein NPIL_420611 [Nephila pilipes]
MWKNFAPCEWIKRKLDLCFLINVAVNCKTALVILIWIHFQEMMKTWDSTCFTLFFTPYQASTLKPYQIQCASAVVILFHDSYWNQDSNIPHQEAHAYNPFIIFSIYPASNL